MLNPIPPCLQQADLKGVFNLKPKPTAQIIIHITDYVYIVCFYIASQQEADIFGLFFEARHKMSGLN
jgi:hypothetical protein